MTRLLSLIFFAAPFAVALFRARQAGDLRMLWMAVAASLTTMAVIAAARAVGRRGTAAIVALVLATLTAIAAGALQGTTIGVGLILVAIAFGISLGIAAALYVR